MTNNQLIRIGKALDSLGSSINAFAMVNVAGGSQQAFYWLVAGFACNAIAKAWGTIFVESDGGAKAAEQLPTIARP